jgi:uncharacterized membrane protein (DUF4010 family)
VIDQALQQSLFGLATALGSGLLIGVERERRKGVGASRGFAGIRTFALASFTGALVAIIANDWLLFGTLLSVAALAVVSHWRDTSADPGTTTEIALIATFVNGILAISQPALSAGVAVVIVSLLFMRTAAQRFARVLSEDELGDALVLASLALILLPLLPDRMLHEYVPINPHRAMRLVVLVSAIQAFGYIMMRMFGGRFGVPVSGLVSGFVSSSATHASMASRARETPAIANACVSGAVLSNVATGVQALTIVAAFAPKELVSVAPYLASMIFAAAIAGGIAFRRNVESVEEKLPAHAFSLKQAFSFALLLTAVSAATVWLQREWGDAAAIGSVLLSAIVDVHVAIASLLNVSAEKSVALSPALLLLCLTINTIAKAVVTVFISGRSRYTIEVISALSFIAVAPWATWWFMR